MQKAGAFLDISIVQIRRVKALFVWCRFEDQNCGFSWHCLVSFYLSLLVSVFFFFLLPESLFSVCCSINYLETLCPPCVYVRVRVCE